MQAEQAAETLSTCRFAQRMMQVKVEAVQNGGLAGVHGNLFKLDPVMQQYLQVCLSGVLNGGRSLLLLVLGSAERPRTPSCEPESCCRQS